MEMPGEGVRENNPLRKYIMTIISCNSSLVSFKYSDHIKNIPIISKKYFID